MATTQDKTERKRDGKPFSRVSPKNLVFFTSSIYARLYRFEIEKYMCISLLPRNYKESVCVCVCMYGGPMEFEGLLKIEGLW